ncbi:GTPase [Lacisediminimonas sp.]|uniref:GTPase n=1 Tax=Lacisediminimonas sp. TaxID=3060582 RepID=UPI002724722E|nr:GTPase [Lacisediminimonas sp.]MDO8300783.1 GTPase [Lacisediminimonas sp.]
MADATPIPTLIVAGGSAAEREHRIADALANRPPARTAVLLEGLPDGSAHLQESPELVIARTVAGCLCCTGNLVMKVTLNRLLRTHPSQLFIGVASTGHLAALHLVLSSPPYSAYLCVMQEGAT